MAYISKHDSKEERKGDSCKDGRIDFLVPRHSVGVDDFLGNFGIGVGIKGRWRLNDFHFLKLRRRGNHFDPRIQFESF